MSTILTPLKNRGLKKIEPEREAEIIKDIEALIELGGEDYIKHKLHTSLEYNLIVFDFYRLPKTDLHKKFDEVILTKVREVAAKRDEGYMIKQLQKGLDEAKRDEKYADDLNATASIMSAYSIANITDTDNDRLMLVAIKYSILHNNSYVYKCGKGQHISKKKHPNLYQDFLSRSTEGKQ